MNRVIRRIRFFWQRLARGWDDSDTWNLDQTLACWIVPRLKVLRRDSSGYPLQLTERKWDVILYKIIRAFEIVRDEEWGVPEHYKATVDEGLDLFRKHFFDLWD